MDRTKGRDPPTDTTHSQADRAQRLHTDAHIGHIIQLFFKNHLTKKVMKTTAVNTPTTGKNEKLNGTTVNNAKTENGTTAKKVNGLPLSKDFDDPKAETEPKKTEAPKTEPATPQTEQPKAEPTKMQLKEQLKEKKAPLNLDSTIKLIEILHRRKIQRDKLLGTIGTLEAFEVAQQDEDDADTAPYQRCDLTITDDNGNKFSTKNPFIIHAVAKYINTLCVDKLTEIEGGIVIPD